MISGYSRKGFTLIELSLSLVFISILSLSVVLIINNTVASYRRGLMLNRVNTSGVDLVDEFREAVKSASSGSLRSECVKYFGANGVSNCQNDNGQRLVEYVKKSTMDYNGERVEDIPLFGAFCTGTYSYIWNSGYYDLASNFGAQPAVFKYKDSNSNTENSMEGFRLLKVRDSSRAVCVSRLSENYSSDRDGSSEFNLGDMRLSSNATLIDILKNENRNNLALYDLNVARPAEDLTTGNAFYSVSFVLGTAESGMNIKAKGKSCSSESAGAGSFDYCAINKFNFAVQVNGA